MLTKEEIETLLARINRNEPGQLDYCALADAAPDLARTALAALAQVEALTPPPEFEEGAAIGLAQGAHDRETLLREIARLKVDTDAAVALVVEQAAAKAREWAENYSPRSDGRNTFVMYAEWVETLADPTGVEALAALRAGREAAVAKRNDSERVLAGMTIELELLAAANAALGAQVARLVEALVDQNDLLRSAMQIAKREGVDGQIASTNWDAYYNRVAVILKRHHDTVNEARAAIAAVQADARREGGE